MQIGGWIEIVCGVLMQSGFSPASLHFSPAA
jgi:hypothetical protein